MAGTNRATEQDVASPDRGVDSEREYQELWFALARRKWGSVVVVPVDPGSSAAPIAKALAEVGNRLTDVRVTAITVDRLEYGSTLALADLQQHVERERRRGGDRLPAIIDVTAPLVSEDPRDGSYPPGAELVLTAPMAKLVIAIPAVVSEPLGLGVIEDADAVILYVELGRTLVEDVKRTVDRIGRERIAGCFLVN